MVGLMQPRVCQVKHNPPESYGDCIRACIATILDRDDVPHTFTHENFEQCWNDLRIWLKPLGYAPFLSYFDNEFSLDEVLEFMRINNPDSVYMLMASAGGSDHCVVCEG